IILTIIVVILISIDLTGLTPMHYSGFLDKGYRIQHDTAACRGDGVCLDVCPRHCFIRIKEKPFISLSSPETCINCGACIVQCQYDALMFMNAKEVKVLPEEIRRYKLTLSGKRKETEQ
ncbi:MAG: 4Fe-4S binding protein, partial [Spirochaetales bacterium]|nr:4Fe-4S binding protein [Spirochaetales bacterium]